MAPAVAPRSSGSAGLARPLVERVVATMPFARVVRRDLSSWTVQIADTSAPVASSWRDVYTARSYRTSERPALVVTPQQARSNALTCMRYASEFQSVYVPLLVRFAELYARSDGRPVFGGIAGFLLDAKKRLFDLERRASENWAQRKSYLPFGYVKAGEHWSALVTAACQFSTTLEA